MEKTDISLREMYKWILEGYLLTNSDHSLYEAQQFSKELIKKNISPEEMVNLHVAVVQDFIPNLAQEIVATNKLLLEVMVGYGQEHLSLKDRQKKIDSEFAVAAKMQQQLLPKVIPFNETLEIGIKSVAAHLVSGDYYHFNEENEGYLGVAVADIIGKGIPAALCMSMIKYAMDSLTDQCLQPSALLENLNRVVEQNISSNMFITMIYGLYDLDNHLFYYSGAGHEHGFYYQASSNQFFDLTTKGLVLGVTKKAKFQEYKRNVEKGDLLILLSDGVTECQSESGFLERIEVTKLIKKYLHLPAQEIVENVYIEIERIQSFQLKDDFTLMIIRRV